MNMGYAMIPAYSVELLICQRLSRRLREVKRNLGMDVSWPMSTMIEQMSMLGQALLSALIA